MRLQQQLDGETPRAATTAAVGEPVRIAAAGSASYRCGRAVARAGARAVHAGHVAGCGVGGCLDSVLALGMSRFIGPGASQCSRIACAAPSGCRRSK